ncbi:hypothetical protein ACFFK0_24755 [Paenibacillus chartarius]|uniref:Uncharacterized protein n=1 Tax=Paenibacillus chartarius TaxID=747481 RepID=A0ABV6DSH2_9BACL
MNKALIALLVYAATAAIVYGIGDMFHMTYFQFHTEFELERDRLHVETGSVLPMLLALPVYYITYWALRRRRSERT